MNMKKIAVLALSLTMVAAIAITGTIAYFTDNDTKTNTFTYGNVDIELDEYCPETELIPGEENALDKVVYVKNTGSEDAYMWIELWIPEMIDVYGDPAANNLHFNPFNTYKDKDDNLVLCRQAFANANGYTLVAETVEVELDPKEIDGVMYNGYREYIADDTPKATGEATAALLARVFMDKGVTQCTDATHADDCLVLADGNTHYDGSWEIIVNAYGIQADSFETIEEAIAAYDGEVL